MKWKQRRAWPSLHSSLRMLAHFQMGVGKNVVYDEREVHIDGHHYPYLVFHPPKKIKLRGTIAVIHGMAPQGMRDERLIHLGRGLAYAGYRTITPQIEGIRRLEIASEQIDEVAQLLQWIAGQDDLMVGPRLGALAPSFSAAILLAAASRDDVRPHMASLCCLGGFANVETILEYLFLEPDVDEYGRMIILKNFIHGSIGEAPELVDILEYALHASYENRPFSEVEAYLEEHPEEVARLFQKLLTDRAERAYHLERMKAYHEDTFQHFHIDRYVEDLEAPVFLLHGAGDRVIPPTESVILYRAMTERGLPARMCLTPFISHGDHTLSFRMVNDLIDIIRGFTFFFRMIPRPR